ncbi:hypothetical protein [Demequina litorisediminis]|uniref:Uncharacterized protein n=1 Tax=Demequina litorisediminis TaxID=1849022 RepID=A0ABQ6II46_9MICO|nr:hypothetical protein [Demequina litorisediminis]GMA36427.1 hypothetical protein GCM10025876_26310 [Demequina litorisediminis]
MSRRAITSATLIAALLGTTMVAIPTAAHAAEQVTITPNPAYAGDEFEGWGTSLVWFANATGGYPADVRQDLFDKVFGDDGLNLNIARYNIGGGNATDVPSYLRPGGAVEGWWNPDLEAEDDEGTVTATYADRDRYAAVWDGDDPASYNLDADATQRWWLDALAGTITTWEAFSNSPPYFLTESGFVSGGINNGSSEQARGRRHGRVRRLPRDRCGGASRAHTASISILWSRSTSPTPTTGPRGSVPTAGPPRRADRRAPTSAPRPRTP